MSQRMDHATAAELVRLELLLMDPVVRKDRDQVAALLDEDFMEFGASGRVWTRETTLDLLLSESNMPPTVEGFSCFWLGAEIALVTYRTVHTGDEGNNGATLRSSIWTKESGKWKMRFHQATRAIE